MKKTTKLSGQIKVPLHIQSILSEENQYGTYTIILN